jgi:5-methylcytosine-specific restriction enzyme subunit McrC
VSAVAAIELTELGEPIEVPLTTDQARLLAASEVVSIVPTLDHSGRWFVGPAGKVGAARIGDLTVRITPKVKIARLLFLLGYSVHGPAWQPSAVDLGTSADLAPAIATALWR